MCIYNTNMLILIDFLQPSSFALKMVDISKSNKKEKIMLEREIQLLRDLKKYEHKNIVKYIDFFTHDHYTCIVMEYCERGTLYEYVRKYKVVKEPKFIEILSQIASGLAVSLTLSCIKTPMGILKSLQI